MDSVATAVPTVFQNSIVIDGLISGPPALWFLDELQGAGYTAVNWTVSSGRDDLAAAISKISQFYWLLEQNPDKAVLVERSSDIERAKRDGKLGIILGFQGAGPLGTNPHLIRIFRQLGVRIIAVTYNESNQYGSGCLEPGNGRLTRIGVQAVREMNRVGVLQDLTHLGERTSLDAIDASADPAVFTHSNPRATWDNPRNITNEQITACASRGGVIGLSVFSGFVGDTWNGRNPTLEEYLCQLDYMLDLVGPNHVAIGTDICIDHTGGVWWRSNTRQFYPEVCQGMTFETHDILGFKRHSDFGAVAQAMLNRGYNEQDVRQIIGGNWLRVFQQVWDKTP